MLNVRALNSQLWSHDGQHTGIKFGSETEPALLEGYLERKIATVPSPVTFGCRAKLSKMIDLDVRISTLYSLHMK